MTVPSRHPGPDAALRPSRLREARAICPTAAAYPMYEQLRAAGTLRSWQIRYCGNDFGACIRRRMEMAGRSVPQNLLPDGQLLRFSGAFKLSG